MSFKSFVRGLFGTKTVNVAECRADINVDALAVSAFATFAVIEQIAGFVSKVEFKTYQSGKEFRGLEWHNLNIKPNVNQSSTEFWKEAVANLLMSGELLIIPVGQQKIIADSFCKTERAIAESTFSSVTRGDFTFNRVFKSSEVFYIKYSNTDVAAILGGIFKRYADLITEASEKYMKAGGEKGTLEIPGAAMGAPDFENKYKDLMNVRFQSFYKAKSAVLPLFNGMKYAPANGPGTTKASNEISDIKNLFDEAISRAAQAYKMPPQLIRGEVSGINDAMDYALTVCIDPLVNSISEELSGKEFSAAEIIAGDYIDADTTNIRHIDIFSLAANVDKLISSGFMSIDETRLKAGLTATGEEWAKRHFITKNYEDIEHAGGEKV